MARRSGKTVGSYEAKTHLSELIEEVEQGAEITITRHGTPVARLVPVRRGATRKDRDEAIRDWRNRSDGITLGDVSLRELIEKGRS
jgi:prevent-host-death family protein